MVFLNVAQQLDSENSAKNPAIATSQGKGYFDYSAEPSALPLETAPPLEST